VPHAVSGNSEGGGVSIGSKLRVGGAEPQEASRLAARATPQS
jgi:hypothetical protein